MTGYCTVCKTRIDPVAGTVHPMCALDPPATREEIRDALSLLYRQLGARPPQAPIERTTR